MTDHSFTERSSAGLVEVYDGNLGISVVPVSIINSNPIASSLCGDICSVSASGKMGRIYFKGSTSSPPSLTHYCERNMYSTILGNFDNDKIWVGCNDKRRAHQADNSSESRVDKGVKTTVKSSKKAIVEAEKGKNHNCIILGIQKKKNKDVKINDHETLHD